MSSDMWYLIEVIAIAYLIGNISPSSLMARSEGIDIRSMGSGNAGTTNALRIMGAKAGLITLVVDVCKGTIATLVGGSFSRRSRSYVLCCSCLRGSHLAYLL